jgi:cytochrome c oxidase subunit 3
MSDAAHHHGSPFIQHHFEGPEHQFDSGKFGIWCFLAQEILFFSALFVSYIVYRSHHPEIFQYAHHFLDPLLGGINTLVLIGSSLTAAWAVRAAQLGQRKILILCLVGTICGALGFLGIKYKEYSHKTHMGVLFGKKFHPKEDYNGVEFPREVTEAPPSSKSLPTPPTKVGDKKATGAESSSGAESEEKPELPPPNTSMFFTIYFAMTGLHGLHVVAGLLVFIWLLIRAIKGHFTPRYFGPVDFAALYWHLVDLIWIYLFPLLYLID